MGWLNTTSDAKTRASAAGTDTAPQKREMEEMRKMEMDVYEKGENTEWWRLEESDRTSLEFGRILWNCVCCSFG